MTDSPCDFAVLGGGSAGYAAARTASRLGLKTIVIDGSNPMGGLCILRGCMPSKALIESANRFLTLRRAGEFGLRAHDIEVHPDEIQRRKSLLINDFAGYRTSQLEDGPFQLIRGHGKFLDPHTIDVRLGEKGENVRVHAASTVITTGSVVSRLPLPGIEAAGYWTSDDVLASDTIPKSVVVLGGGAIALEMAHYLEALGSTVTIVQRSPRVLKELDADVARAVEHAFTARGIKLYCDTHLERASGAGSDGLKSVHFTHRDQEVSAKGEQILMALGRIPATSGLQLDRAGVETDGGRILTDASQATSVPNIFAAGDVSSPHEIVHIAIEQGEIAATNAAALLKPDSDLPQQSIDYRLKLIGIFTQPQVASVGLTKAEAEAAGHSVRTATYPFDDHGKSMILGETEGFVKLVAAADSGEIIGAAAVGPEAVELIHEVVVAMHFHATAGQLARIPHYHPTLSEIWTYPAEELAGC